MFPDFEIGLVGIIFGLIFVLAYPVHFAVWLKNMENRFFKDREIYYKKNRSNNLLTRNKKVSKTRSKVKQSKGKERYHEEGH